MLALFAIPELIRHREEVDACQDPNSPAIGVLMSGGGGGSGGVLSTGHIKTNGPTSIVIGLGGAGGTGGTFNSGRYAAGTGGSSGGTTSFGDYTVSGGSGGNAGSGDNTAGNSSYGNGGSGGSGGGTGASVVSVASKSTANTVPWHSLGPVGNVQTGGGGVFNNASRAGGLIGYGTTGQNFSGGAGGPGVVYVLRGIYN